MASSNVPTIVDATKGSATIPEVSVQMQPSTAGSNAAGAGVNIQNAEGRSDTPLDILSGTERNPIVIARTETEDSGRSAVSVASSGGGDMSEEDESTESASTGATTQAAEPVPVGELGQLMLSCDEDALDFHFSLHESPTNMGFEVEKLYDRLKKTLSGKFVDYRGDREEDSSPVAPAYGQPLSEAEAAARISGNDGGLIWNATIIPDTFFNKDGVLHKGLNPKDFDKQRQLIKPRRPSILVTNENFFSSITKVRGKIHGGKAGKTRYIFYGVLNGWPGLRCLELISLEKKRKKSSIPTPMEIMSGRIGWAKTWSVNDHGNRGLDPEIRDKSRVYRAKLRGGPWSSKGWSSSSPGFVFWYESKRPTGPLLSYGKNMLTTLTDAKCTSIHMISHRYALLKESPKDLLTYHSLCLLEWDHGEYCTVVEAAYLNGVSGYKGKSNWHEDKDAPITALFSALPPEMILPWSVNSAELRCYDVEAKSFDEFKLFIKKYTGPDKRFLDPHYTFSHPARITFRSKTQIAQFLINYISRDNSYGELKRNCQTFAADLCSFIAGKKGIAPFHPVNRIDYQNRTHLFLYDSHMFN